MASEPTDPDETVDHRPADPTSTTAPESASTAEARLTESPARIGKYLVVGELDDGGQATVYRVVHPGTGQDLALKIAKERAAVGETDLDLSASEARILGELDHPGLVKVVDLDRHDGHMFLVMEYVRGRSLQQYAKDHTVSSREAARLVIQVAAAAESVHRRGVVHQDIKPKNILVDESRRARLIDFGLARWRHAWSLTEHGPSGGTPEFMAPEQAQGTEDWIGPRTDVFALGAVLYYLLTGRAPFHADGRLEALDRARRSDFDRAALKKAGVPRRLERIVLKAMATGPAERHASAEALARALGAYLRRPVVMSSLAVLLLIPAVFLGAWSRWSSSIPAPERTVVIVAPPAVPDPLSGEVDVWIWDPNDPARQRLALNDSGAMPLRAGDQIRVEARVNRPAHLYLVWIDAEGVPQPVYPWRPGDWSELAVEDRPVTHVSLPANEGRGWPMKQGASGMETLILLAREEPLDLDLKSRLGDLPRAALQDARSLVWFEDWSVVRDGSVGGSSLGSRARGPCFFDVDIKDPVLQILGLLKERLKDHFSMMRAVSFANRGG
jgi:serine/threonine protein kinase